MLRNVRISGMPSVSAIGVILVKCMLVFGQLSLLVYAASDKLYEIGIYLIYVEFVSILLHTV